MSHSIHCEALPLHCPAPLLAIVSPPGHTCVLRSDRKSALTGGEDLQFNDISGAGEQLRGLHQRAVLRAGPVYRQKDVTCVQRSTPERETAGQSGSGKLLFIGKCLCSSVLGEVGFTFPPRCLPLSCL